MKQKYLGLALGISLGACQDAVAPPDRTGPCGGGASHAGSVLTETWLRKNNPHHLTADVVVNGVLTIEPGVVVCADSAVGILANNSSVNPNGGIIIARGTLAVPIVFTGAQTNLWKGIQIGADYGGVTPSDFVHVTVEHSLYGFNILGPAVVDSSRFHQIAGSAIAVGYYGFAARITHNVIDTCGRPNQWGSAVYLEAGTFEDNIVRGARGNGITLEARTQIPVLGGGRIEGSGGIGILALPKHGRIRGTKPIRVVGGRSYPVSLSIADVKRIWPTTSDMDSLRGNAIDTVLVDRADSDEQLVIPPGLPWRMQARGFSEIYVPALRIQPGASFSGTASFGRLTAQGSNSALVTLKGIFIFQGDNSASRIANARITGVIVARGTHTLSIDSSRIEAQSAVYLGSPDSRVDRSILDGLQATTATYPLTVNLNIPGGVTLAGARTVLSNSIVRNALSVPAVWIEADGVRVDSVDFTGSRASTVIVTNVATGVTVSNSNFPTNVIAIANPAPASVDARNNWWGSPAGPGGTNAATFTGSVQYTPFRTAPVFISASPAPPPL